MDQTIPTINPELPKSQESLPPLGGEEVVAGRPIEKLDLASQSERLSSAASAVSQVVQDDQSPAASQQSALQDSTSAGPVTNQSSTSLIADDVDVIEKIWVQKAKAIVSETRDDPRKQSVELSHMKRDYIKKRFNKDLISPNG